MSSPKEDRTDARELRIELMGWEKKEYLTEDGSETEGQPHGLLGTIMSNGSAWFQEEGSNQCIHCCHEISSEIRTKCLFHLMIRRTLILVVQLRWKSSKTELSYEWEGREVMIMKNTMFLSCIIKKSYSKLLVFINFLVQGSSKF